MCERERKRERVQLIMTVRVCLSLGMHMVDETQLKGVRGFKTFVCANGCEKPRKSQRKRKKE